MSLSWSEQAKERIDRNIERISFINAAMLIELRYCSSVAETNLFSLSILIRQGNRIKNKSEIKRWLKEDRHTLRWLLSSKHMLPHL